jgi:hypothetical protein
VLLARTFAIRNEVEALASMLGSINVSELADDELRMLNVLKLIGHDDDVLWKAALDSVENLPSSHRIEMLKLASKAGRLSDDRLQEVATLRKTNAIWARRETEV